MYNVEKLLIFCWFKGRTILGRGDSKSDQGTDYQSAPSEKKITILHMQKAEYN